MALLDEAARIDSTNAGRIVIVPSAASFAPRQKGVRVPLSIPSDQEYYWRYDWQADERAALREIEAGDVYRFESDDPDDAARFLDEADLDPNED